MGTAFCEEAPTASFACPVCREDRIDQLVLRDDSAVECLACGHRYQPPDEEEENEA